MDAPHYPPAAAYVQPVPAPYELSIRTISIGELMAWPAAWEIVTRHLPMVKLMVASDQFKPVRGNMTLPDMATFVGPTMAPQYAPIDAELKQLPASGRPTL
jgi:hypothetical protein